MASCVLSCRQLCIHNAWQERLAETTGKVLQGSPPSYQYTSQALNDLRQQLCLLCWRRWGFNLSDVISTSISFTKPGTHESGQSAITALL